MARQVIGYADIEEQAPPSKEGRSSLGYSDVTEPEKASKPGRQVIGYGNISQVTESDFVDPNTGVSLKEANDIIRQNEAALKRIDLWGNVSSMLTKSKADDEIRMAEDVIAKGKYDADSRRVIRQRAKERADAIVNEGRLPDPNKQESSWSEVLSSIYPRTKAMGGKAMGGIVRNVGELVGSETLTESGKMAYKGADIAEKEAAPNVPYGSPKFYVGEAGPSVLQQIPLLATGIVTGQAWLPLTAFYGTSYGQRYGEKREEGAGIGSSMLSAHGYGGSEALTELIPVGVAVKAFKTPFSRMGAVGTRFAKGELFGENINTLTQSMQNFAEKYPEKSLKEWSDTLPAEFRDTTVQTIIQTLALGGFALPIVKVKQRAYLGGVAKDISNRTGLSIEEARPLVDESFKATKDDTTGKTFTATLQEKVNTLIKEKRAEIEKAPALSAEMKESMIASLNDKTNPSTIFDIQKVIIKAREDNPKLAGELQSFLDEYKASMTPDELNKLTIESQGAKLNAGPLVGGWLKPEGDSNIIRDLDIADKVQKIWEQHFPKDEAKGAPRTYADRVESERGEEPTYTAQGKLIKPEVPRIPKREENKAAGLISPQPQTIMEDQQPAALETPSTLPVDETLESREGETIGDGQKVEQGGKEPPGTTIQEGSTEGKPKTLSWTIKAEFEDYNRKTFESLAYVGKLVNRQELDGGWLKLTYEEKTPQKTVSGKTKTSTAITDETPFPYYRYFTRYPKFRALLRRLRKGDDLTIDPSFVSFVHKFNEDMDVGNIPYQAAPSGKKEWIEDEVQTLIKDEMDKRKSGGQIAPVTITATDEELQVEGFSKEVVDEIIEDATINIQGIREELHEEGYSNEEISAIVRGVEASSNDQIAGTKFEERLTALKEQVRQSREQPKPQTTEGGELFDTSSMFNLSGNQPTAPAKTFKPGEKKGTDRLLDVKKQTPEELKDRLSGEKAKKEYEEEKEYGANNKIFTKDEAEKARKRLKEMLNELQAGINPELLMVGMKLAGYHIEAGARKFKDYSSKMISDVGDKIKPYLKSLYLAVRNYPGFDNKGMDTEAEIEKLEAEPTKIAFTDKENNIETQVVKNDKGFAVITKDIDSGEQLDTIKIYPTEAEAINAAQEIVAGKKKEEDPFRTATGILGGERARRAVEKGYQFVKGDLDKKSGMYWDMVGILSGGYADRLLGSGITVEKVKEEGQPKTPGTIGKNKYGQDIFEDAKGVRSIIQNGIRTSEAVGLIPTRGGIVMDISHNDDRYIPVEQTKVSFDMSLSETIRDLTIKKAKPYLNPDNSEQNILISLERWAQEAQGEVVNDLISANKPLSESQRVYLNTWDKKSFAEAVLKYIKRHNLIEQPAKSPLLSGRGATIPLPSQQIAGSVKTSLLSGTPITQGMLFSWANDAYGGTMAEGKYQAKDAYDALEMGINQYIYDQGYAPIMGTVKRTTDTIDLIRKDILDKIPSQAGLRSEEQDEFQQFSTPPDLSYTMAWVADIGNNDTVLEPSAGIGGIAVFARNADAKVIVNELSPRRAAILKELGIFDTVYTENAEQIYNILNKEVSPTVVLMNPPFSSTAGRIQGQRKSSNVVQHLDQALKLLQPNGRMVALIGKGWFDDPRAVSDYFTNIKQNYNLRAIITIGGKGYAKYGTTYDNRILVIDKTAPENKPTLEASVEDVKDAIPLLKEVRDARAPIIEQRTTESKGETVSSSGEAAGRPIQPVLPTTGKVGTGTRRPEGAVPGTGNVKSNAPVEAGIGNEPVGEGELTRPDGAFKPPEWPEGTNRPRVGGTRSASGSLSADPGIEQGTEQGLKIEVKESERAKEELTDSVYESYTPQKLTIKNAKGHPGKLVESAAMSVVTPPDPTYSPKLPETVIKSGQLSLAQLEAIVYAGQAHQQMLTAPVLDDDGKAIPGKFYRKGYFIGDGTGVGKGREIAGIVRDNFNQGRKKAIWISQNAPLINDAKRDVKGTGWESGLVFDVSKKKLTAPITVPQGIAFLGYDLLKSKDKKKPEISRLNQIVKWFGKDFDGVIVFDESHNMGNAIAVKGVRGTSRPAAKAIAGMELQRLLPNARIVYVSATGATEVMNLAYADRLGLWGQGTPFASKQDFVGQIASGGIAAMEFVARDMKAMGNYLSRSLSYEDVKYEHLEHNLTGEQRTAYDKMADAWQMVLSRIDEALGLTGGAHSGNATSAAKSAFWGAELRFFNHVITSMQTVAVVNSIEQDLKKGHAVILQIVDTNEAAEERALAKMEEGDELEDLDTSPLEQLMQYVHNSFPVAQYEEVTDPNDHTKTIWVPVLDSNGAPVENPEAVAQREQLLIELGGIAKYVPNGALDMIIDHFGPEKVAEITGRKRRIITVEDEQGKHKAIERRSESKTMADADAYMADKKPILIFSYKGGTGRSYHADLSVENQRLRRHYLLQAGWRADRAIQGFGRSHRSSQKQAPEYILVTTDIIGQKRFISSIARRLDQLGALTRGQRETGSGGFFTARDNLESVYAEDAVNRLVHDIYHHQVEGWDIGTFMQQAGLPKLIDDRDGSLNERAIPPVTQFMNLLLAMNLDRQVELFGHFSERLDANIRSAMARGTLDVGLETLRAKKIEKVSEQIVHVDERSGAETKYVQLDVTRDSPRYEYEQIKYMWGDAGFYRNIKSGQVWAASGGKTKTDAKTGHIATVHRLRGPKGTIHEVDTEDLHDKEKYELLQPTEAETSWDKEYKELPETVTYQEHFVTGALLPVWDRLKGRARIMRVQTDEGERMIGRLIAPDSLPDTLRKLGATQKQQSYTPEEIFSKVRDQGFTVELSNDWKIKRKKIANETRIEITGPDYRHIDELKRYGVFVERVNWETRYFIPTTNEGIETIRAITASKPVVNTVAPLSTREDLGMTVKEGQSVYERPLDKDQIKELQSKQDERARRLLGQEAIRDLQANERSGNISAKTGKVAVAGGVATGTRALGISPTLIKQGYVDLRGAEAKDARDIAALAQVFRDPRFETFRYIYVKDGKVVAIEGVTSRVPGQTMMFKDSRVTVDIYKTKNRAKRLGADGIWVVHNHPSGTPVPSDADMRATERLAAKLPILGHVIIDSQSFAEIKIENGRPSVILHEFETDNAIMQATLDHPVLKETIANRYDVANVAKAIQAPTGFATIIYQEAGRALVRAIQDFPIKALTSVKGVGDHIRGQARAFGGDRAFIVIDRDNASYLNDNVKDVLDKLVISDILTDVVYYDAASTSIYHDNPASTSSVRASLPNVPSSDRYWMGQKVKAYKVSEEGAPYSATRSIADILADAKKESGIFDDKMAKETEPPSKDATPEEIDSWMKRETGAIFTHLTRTFGTDSGFGKFLEKMLKSPEWWTNPVLKRIVHYFADTRSEAYHEYIYHLNNIDDHNVIKETEDMAKKSPEKYKQLLWAIDYGDTSWKRGKESMERLQDPDITREARLAVIANQVKKYEEFLRSKGLPEDVIGLWKLHRTSYDRALDLMTEQMREMIAELEDQQLTAGATMDESRAELLKTLRGYLANMEEWRGFYAPRMRQPGDWELVLKKGDDKVRLHGSSWEMERAWNKMKAEGWTPIGPVQEGKSPVREVKRLPEEIYQSLKTVDVAKAITYAMERSSETAEVTTAFNDEVLELVSDMMKARGFRSTMIHRTEGKVMKGYEEDPLTRYVRYTNNISSGLAKAKVARLAYEAVLGAKNEKGKREGGLHPVEDKREYVLAQQYITAQLRNLDHTDRLIGLAKSLATFKFLGINPRSILVNLTALSTTAPAAVHQYAGQNGVSMSKVLKEIVKASKDAAQLIANKSPNLNEHEKEYIEKIKKEGWDDPQYAKDAMGAMQKTHRKWWNKTMNISMWGFAKSEQLNRLATLLAGYRIAYSQAIKAGLNEKEAVNKAEQLAKSASDKAHGIYGRATLPMIAQLPYIGKVGQLMYVYGKFGHNYVQMLWDLGMNKHNFKALAWGLISPIILAGGTVLPFKDALWGMLGAILKVFGIGGDPEKSFWDWIRKQFGKQGEKLGRYGLMGGLGVDISGSLSVGIDIPQNLKDLGGAPWGVIEDVIKAGHFLATGRPQRAFEKVVPTSVANISRAFRERNEGVTTERGFRVFTPEGKPYKPSLGDMALRFGGFRSSEEATLSSRTQEAKGEKAHFEEKKKSIYEQYRGYIANPDRTKKEHDEIMRKVTQFNKQLREEGIKEVPRITFEQMRMQMKRMQKPTMAQKRLYAE